MTSLHHHPISRRTFTSGAFALLACLLATSASAQSIYSNPITDSNPSAFNPYTIGQTFNSNITVSGLGRGTGVGPNAGTGRYNANSWNTPSLDTTAFFDWTLTPNSGFSINFTSLTGNWQRSSTGPTTYNLRSSLDSFGSNVASGTITGSGSSVGFSLSLGATAFDNITAPITFRLFAFGASSSAGTFSINDFVFNGTVAPASTGSGDLLITTAGPLNFGRIIVGQPSPAFTFDVKENNVAATSYTVTANNPKLNLPAGAAIAQNQTQTLNLTANTATSGSLAGTVTVNNTNDPSDKPTINTTGAVVAQRVVTAQADTLRAMVGQTTAVDATLTTTGSDDQFTRITVDGQLFNDAADTKITPVSVTAPATPGPSVVNAASLAVTGEGLTGEGTYANVNVNVNVQALEDRDLTGGSVSVKAILGTSVTGTVNVTGDAKADNAGTRLQLTNNAVTDGGLTLTGNGDIFNAASQTHTVGFDFGTALPLGITSQTTNIAPIVGSAEISGSPVVIAFDNFETDANLVSFSQSPTPTQLTNAGDGFREYTRGSGSFPFNLVDDSVTAANGGAPFPTDAQGVIGRNKTDTWFGITDTDGPGANPGGAFTATWVFDISNYGDLSVAIDMGAMGDFESTDTFNFEYAIDGSSFSPLFTSSVTGGTAIYTFDDGDAITLANPLRMTNAQGLTTILNRANAATGALQTLVSELTGTGSELTIRLTGATNAETNDDAFAFDSITVSGVGFGLLPGQTLDDTVDVTVNVEVVNASNASFFSNNATATGDTRTINLGSTSSAGSLSTLLSLFNVGNSLNTAALDLLSITYLSGDDLFTFSLSSFANLAAGGSQSLTVDFLAPTGIGSYTGVYQFLFADEAGILGGGNETLTLTLQAGVAIPEPASILLALGGLGLITTRTRLSRSI